GLRTDFRARALRRSTDPDAGTLTFSAQLARDLHEILLHALVDTSADVIRQIDALHADIDEVDAEIRDIAASLPDHVLGHRGSISRDNLFERALRNHTLDTVFHDL